MPKRFKTTTDRPSAAQMVTEYAMTLAIVVMMVVTMTIFVKRLLQARMKDAHDFMMETARNSYGGVIDDEYEPYYSISNSQMDQKINDSSVLDRGGTTGAFTKTYNEERTVNTISEQTPPISAPLY